MDAQYLVAYHQTIEGVCCNCKCNLLYWTACSPQAAVLPLVKSNSKLVEKETFTATVCLQGLYPLHDNE